MDRRWESLRERGLMIGFALMAVLLGALVRTDTAFAQCGPAAGSKNTACGAGVLTHNTGTNDSAFGFKTLFNNTNGGGNTASGVEALFSNQSGDGNVAVGRGALGSNKTGKFNIGIGIGAGSAIFDTDSNIEIGTDGFSGDRNIMRLGEPTPGGQTQTFIAGIRDVTLGIGAEPVYIDDFNQLGNRFPRRHVTSAISATWAARAPV